METNGRRVSLWLGTAELPRFGPLPGDLEADVVVVGAGITGITAARLLTEAGRKVVLIDAIGVLGGETGRTTAHITRILDHRYHVIASHFGRRGAALAAESMQQAIDRIARFVQEDGISCEFRRVPGVLYAETDEQARELRREVDAARRAGVNATLVSDLPLPFPVKLAMRVEDQAQFHPALYLKAHVARLQEAGCRIHTGTRVLDVNDGAPCRVETTHGTIRANDVFVATDVPFNNKFFLITKVAPYRTYAVAARLGRAFPDGLYWDMYDPYHYTRRQKTVEGEFLIVGGKDHRVAEGDENGALASLEQYVRDRYGLTDIPYRWSGQIEEPVDGLAFIGRNTASRHVYVATGYSGTGMAWGTLAAMIVSDLMLGRDNPYAKLYSATRVKPFAQAKEYVAENVDFPLHLMKDRVQPPQARRVLEVPIGEGKLVQVGGRKVAVYRDESGALHTMSPVCTHMGCHVHWNGAEKTWDCPCHGGRYDARGEVVHGPPVRRLTPMDLEEEEEERAIPEAPSPSYS